MQRHSSGADRGGIELSASFFSVKLRRSVAIAEMRNGGHDVEAVWKGFSAKIATSLHGATCGGWKDDVGVDASRLRKMTEENEEANSR